MHLLLATLAVYCNMLRIKACLFPSSRVGCKAIFQDRMKKNCDGSSLGRCSYCKKGNHLSVPTLETRDESTVENRAQPNHIQALAAAVAQVQQHYMPAKHPEDIEAHSQLNDAIWQIFSICGSLIGKRAGHQELTPREFAKSIAIALHRFHQRMMMALMVARSRNWFEILRFGMLRERIL
eukprot:scaffold363_cov209-Alexandrium_tamarense.AAC.13